MEGILLQKAQTDHSGNLQDQLLIIRQNIRTNQLYNLHQAALLCQKSHETVAVIYKLLVYVVHIPGGQIIYILGIAGKPMDRRKMPCIGKTLIQSPEAAHKTLGVLGHRLGEIAALG